MEDSSITPFKFKIELAHKIHSKEIADFQVKMALETQNLQLNRELVEKAVDYFLDVQEKVNSFGMYLVSLQQEKVVGCLLLTFENPASWWIQSVYVIESARRKGHFTELFKEAVRLGKAKHIKSIRLYAENDNERAKATYFKLGMKIIQEKMYSYDFVYGNYSLQNEQNQFSIQKVHFVNQALQEWVSDKSNILSGLKYQDIDWNYAYVLKRSQKVCAVVRMFTEFSDWRFGLAWYIRQIYALEEEKKNLQDMINKMIKAVLQIGEPKAAVIRVLFRQSQQIILKGGHLDHYDILELSL